MEESRRGWIAQQTFEWIVFIVFSFLTTDIFVPPIIAEGGLLCLWFDLMIDKIAVVCQYLLVFTILLWWWFYSFFLTVLLRRERENECQQCLFFLAVVERPTNSIPCISNLLCFTLFISLFSSHNHLTSVGVDVENCAQRDCEWWCYWLQSV